MRIYREKDYDGVSRRVAYIIAAQLLLKPDAVLGLATGSTPVGAYERLVEMYQAGIIDFSKARSVNLDEYIGLSGHDPQSYATFMHENLFSKVNMDPANINIPNGMAADPKAEASRYEALIQDMGGIDLQLLGIGLNGHIGFNEPADRFLDHTHPEHLTESTIEANKRFFASGDEVPKMAITMGIRTIFDARRIILAISGTNKAEALNAALRGPISPQMPASILQLHHDLIVVADEAALTLYL